MQGQLCLFNDFWRITVSLDDSDDRAWCVACAVLEDDAKAMAEAGLTAYIGREVNAIDATPYGRDPEGPPDFLNRIVQGVWI